MSQLYQWDNEDLKITVTTEDGVTFDVDNFQSWRYNNGKRISHIKNAVTGVTGYNRVFAEPAWELSFDSTAKCHDNFMKLKQGRKYFNILFISSSYKCTASNCICQDVNPGNTGETSPIVSVHGLALKIFEEYVPDTSFVAGVE
ncbi:hypothetical protein [Bacteroides sp.]|uniref:hypothetical protein n=1 Tax=Bacteroides sp. TaxID=29523 RepID=UPI002632B43F|nr:hypothetical protein [Bacteroides sp.]MDD3039012.1 hypothetical protein [Bacteroides sp.]